MTSKSRILVDHEQIRRWARERGAKPSTVRRIQEDNVGVICLDCPGSNAAGSLEEISWEEWFRDFDENNLVLIVEGEMANGHSSNFNRLVARESLEDYSDGSSIDAKKKSPPRARRTARSSKSNGQGSRKAAGSLKRANERHNREQNSTGSTSGHKSRRKAA